MQTKTLALFALSATAAIASPFHKREDFAHRHRHRTGSASIQPTGSGTPFLAQNDTNGFFHPTGSASVLPITMTVSPLPESSSDAPATFGNAVDATSSSSCLSTSIATETSINLVTVTASAADLAATKVQAGESGASAFYDAGHSRSGYNGGWGQSSATSAAGSFVPSVAGPSTAFASVPSASKSLGMSVSASIPVSASASASAPQSGAATASASASASASAPASGSSGGKRGISYNDASLVSAFGGAVSWAYNWGATSGGSPGVEFVPMMWGKDNVATFADSVKDATHVLSFNEPDLGAQSDVDPQTAAELHKKGMASLVGKVQIGSPAITNGAGTSPLMGTDWLDAFFQACGDGCPVDFVAYHWYATADSIDYFKSHTQDVIDVAAKYGVNKVWLTEFQPEGSATAQASFMKEAVSFLDSTTAVERYAAFMASEGTMLSGKALNTVGSAYAGSS